MRIVLASIAALALTFSACVVVEPESNGPTGSSGAGRQPVGGDAKDQICAGEFAERIDIAMSEVRPTGHDTSASGNTVVFLQTADLERSANCEIDDFGNVMRIDETD